LPAELPAGAFDAAVAAPGFALAGAGEDDPEVTDAGAAP